MAHFTMVVARCKHLREENTHNESGFRHIVHGKERKYLCVAPETFMAIKAYAEIHDLTVVAAHFKSIQVGLAYLMDKEEKRKRDLFRKLANLDRVARDRVGEEHRKWYDGLWNRPT